MLTLIDNIVKSISLIFLLPSSYYMSCFSFLYSSLSCFILLAFLCTLARSHLRPWVCLPRYRVCGYPIRGGRGVPRRFGRAAVGQFVRLSSLLSFSMFHNCTYVSFCFCYCIIILMDSGVLYCTFGTVLTVLCTLVTCTISAVLLPYEKTCTDLQQA